jgi:hypothetical protein
MPTATPVPTPTPTPPAPVVLCQGTTYLDCGEFAVGTYTHVTLTVSDGTWHYGCNNPIDGEYYIRVREETSPDPYTNYTVYNSPAYYNCGTYSLPDFTLQGNNDITVNDAQNIFTWTLSATPPY